MPANSYQRLAEKVPVLAPQYLLQFQWVLVLAPSYLLPRTGRIGVHTEQSIAQELSDM